MSRERLVVVVFAIVFVLSAGTLSLLFQAQFGSYGGWGPEGPDDESIRQMALGQFARSIGVPVLGTALAATALGIVFVIGFARWRDARAQ